MFLEPILQAFPAVLGSFLAIAWTVVGVKTVGRIRVEHDLRAAAGSLQSLTHLLDGFIGNSLVGPSVQSQYRRFQRLPPPRSGYFGCNSLAWPTSRPYQATPAFNRGLWAA